MEGLPPSSFDIGVKTAVGDAMKGVADGEDSGI